MLKVLLVLAAVFIAQSWPADTLSFSLSHAWKVGEARRISVSGDVTSTALIMNWDRPVRSAPYDMKVELVAMEQAAETQSAGKITRARLTVEHLTLNGAELCKPGTVIIAAPDQFTIDGRSVDANLAHVLQVVATSPLIGIAAKDYDVVVGASQPRRIGEHWPLDRQAIASLIAETGYQAKLEDISGDAQLSQLQKDKGLELTTKAHISKAGGTMGGMTILDGTMTVSFSVDFSTNRDAVEPVSWNLDSKNHLYTAGMAKDGHPFTMEIIDEHELESRVLENNPATQPVR